MNIHSVHKAFHKFICAANTLFRMIPSRRLQKSMLNDAVKFSDYSTFQALVTKNPLTLAHTLNSWDNLEFALSAYEWVRQGKPQNGNHWVRWWNSSQWEAPQTPLEKCHATLLKVLKNTKASTNAQVFQQRVLEALEQLIKFSNASNCRQNAPSAADVVLENFEFSVDALPWVLEKCIGRYQDGAIGFCSETVRDTVLQNHWKSVDWMTSAQLDRHSDPVHIAPSWKDVLLFLPAVHAIALIQDHPHIIFEPDFPELFAQRAVDENVTQTAVEHGLVSSMVHAFSSSKDQDGLSVFDCVERCVARRQKRLLTHSIEDTPPAAPFKRKM